MVSNSISKMKFHSSETKYSENSHNFFTALGYVPFTGEIMKDDGGDGEEEAGVL